VDSFFLPRRRPKVATVRLPRGPNRENKTRGGRWGEGEGASVEPSWTLDDDGGPRRDARLVDGPHRGARTSPGPGLSRRLELGAVRPLWAALSRRSVYSGQRVRAGRDAGAPRRSRISAVELAARSPFADFACKLDTRNFRLGRLRLAGVRFPRNSVLSGARETVRVVHGGRSARRTSGFHGSDSSRGPTSATYDARRSIAAAPGLTRCGRHRARLGRGKRDRPSRQLRAGPPRSHAGARPA